MGADGDGDGDGDGDENERRIERIERINLPRRLGVMDHRGTYRHSRRLFLIKSSHTLVMMMRRTMTDDDESWPLARGPLTFLEYLEVAERGWWMRFERFVTPRCYTVVTIHNSSLCTGKIKSESKTGLSGCQDVREN